VERLTHAREVLKQGFEFDTRESYPYLREKAPWPKDDAEVRDLWRKRVKNDWLRLKLAGKDDKAHPRNPRKALRQLSGPLISQQER
jgi:carboxyl-terminal processing protease